MTYRPAAPSAIPAGLSHYYRASDLSGLRLALWEGAGSASLAAYLRDAGAAVEVLPPGDGAGQGLPPLPLRARCAPGGRRGEKIAGGLSAANGHPGGAAVLELDAAVVNLGDPNPLARRLQATGVPFVIFTDHPERCLEHYPAGSCVHREDGPEALASAVLLHVAIFRSGLPVTPDLSGPGMSLIEMVPGLRAMARVLVPDATLADDLLAEAMVQALAYVPTLTSEAEVGALLVMLIERLWHRQKLSRPC
ncbi:hypothetical protein [Paracoccus solventivorans]|uniref:hypothetical protein n=1 Tax=Paracoccus solventivorans TaxID=53463 RepID=UPI0026EDBE89|nr:hypothetical protein [Paracoccus solventivorans]